MIQGDCQNQLIIDKLKSKSLEAIFHIAGQSSGECSFEDPVYDLQTNTQSTVQLLKLALEVECKKFIYASTMSVYGSVNDRSISEDHGTNPKSFYAVGKLASEKYLKIFSEEYGIQSAALRLFNVYGPGQNLTNMKQGMVSIFLAQAIKNNRILVKGSANRYRDFIYIEDVVEAFKKVYFSLNQADKGFSLINICTGTKTTISELLDLIAKEAPFKIEYKFHGNTLGDQFGIYGDATKAFKEINWKAKVSLEEGLKETMKWAIKHNSSS